MSNMNVQTLYYALLTAKTVTQVRNILTQLGDSEEVRPLTPLKPMGLCWFPFGGREANIATINVATHAGRSLTERVTNAIDAVLEDGYDREQKSEPTPRMAAEKWFRRPQSGPDTGLYQIDYTKSGLSKLLGVVLLDSGFDDGPTIDVVDSGIGISNDRFPETILSLNENNKLKKSYVSGRFGQGGSSTLGFSEFVVIFSRSKHKPEEVTFTVIRKINPGEGYAEDMYAYLAFKGPNDKPIAPSYKAGTDAIAFYEEAKGVKPPQLGFGTVVRHVGFRLAGLDGRLSPSPGNLYHYLHCSLLDPIFPFMLYDLRLGGRARQEVVAGSRNRLMKLAERQEEAEEEDEDEGDDTKTPKKVMRHYAPMEFVVPYGKTEATLGIEYWVPFCYRKSAKSDGLVLRSSSNELYVERGHPIVVTMNGQNQGHPPTKFLKDIGFGMVSRHIVVNIDASKCDKDTRQKLFSATREHLKDDTVLRDLLKTLAETLKNDQVLQEVERELTDKLTSEEAEKSSDEVKLQIVRLLEEAGMTKKQSGPTEGGGTEESGGTGGGGGGGGGGPRIPIQTLPFPEVTRLEIVAPKVKAEPAIDGRTTIAIETDGDDKFDEQGLLTITIDSPVLEVAGFTPLRGGRKRWQLRPTAQAQVGNFGHIQVVLSKPTGEALTASVPFLIAEKKQPNSKVIRGNIPDFDVIGVHPVDDADLWKEIWPDISRGDPQELSSVSFTVIRASDICTTIARRFTTLRSDWRVPSETSKYFAIAPARRSAKL